MVVSKVVVVSTVACHRSKEGFNRVLSREVEDGAEPLSEDGSSVEQLRVSGVWLAQEEVGPVA